MTSIFHRLITLLLGVKSSSWQKVVNMLLMYKRQSGQDNLTNGSRSTQMEVHYITWKNWGRRYIQRSSRQTPNLYISLGNGRDKQAEIGTTISGKTWALELGYRKIILKFDSMLTVNWILKKATPQWSICIQFDRLKSLISQTQEFKCSHIFIEANWVADTLSKHSHKLTRPQIYYKSQEIPKEAKAY